MRCSETGKTLTQVVGELTQELAYRGVHVTFVETKLSVQDASKSNLLFFNGVALEDLLDGVKISENACPSCSDLIGEDTSCRTVESDGTRYEEIPESLIRRAALKALGMDVS